MKGIQHTPLPWTCHSGMVWKPDETEDGYPIAYMDRATEKTRPTERDANAEFIVRVCNSHYEMLNALKDGLKFLDSLPADERTTQVQNRKAFKKMLNKAIAKAEGK